MNNDLIIAEMQSWEQSDKMKECNEMELKVIPHKSNRKVI